MNHFSLESELQSALRMDSPIGKGPLMRWQRKQQQVDTCNSSKSESMLNCSAASVGLKTPVKSTDRTLGHIHKTPNKTPGSQGRPGSRTPQKSGGDRFIPCRSGIKFDLAHHLLTKQAEESSTESMSPSQKEYQQVMTENLNGMDIAKSRIISYRNKAPAAPEGYSNTLKVLYSHPKTPGTCPRKTARHIPQVPERILDAPDILDDYYLNLLDWSCHNHLAVCLGGHVYLWNASNGEITQLMEMENNEEYVASVSWVKGGQCLAVGSSSGEVQLWDVGERKRLRNMTGHVARVGALSWNDHILSSGSRSGSIHHHDVRIPNHHTGTLAGHTQEVCGLRWSPDGRYLASGGNDNLLNIWDNTTVIPASNGIQQPLYSFSHHQAAVKALAWCPWQPSVLASGGGTADRNIRFWNCNNGTLLNSVDTHSQVCALLWSSEYRELVSSHGFAQNQLTIWKYPTMTKVAELTGHTSRVLHLAMSPDGSTVVSAAADETLRLWKCFATDPEKKKASAKSAHKSGGSSLLRKGIR